MVWGIAEATKCTCLLLQTCRCRCQSTDKRRPHTKRLHWPRQWGEAKQEGDPGRRRAEGDAGGFGERLMLDILTFVYWEMWVSWTLELLWKHKWSKQKLAEHEAWCAWWQDLVWELWEGGHPNESLESVKGYNRSDCQSFIHSMWMTHLGIFMVLVCYSSCAMPPAPTPTRLWKA